MKLNIGIVGGSGYVGGEILRLLLNHPEIADIQITSRKLQGRYIHTQHPNLRDRTDLKFISPDEIEYTDLLFLCMPHGKSMEQIDTYQEKSERIIDLSADFRVSSTELYETYYSKSHLKPQLLQEFVYGIVETSRQDMRNARYVSSAGCNATASILALEPLIRSIDNIKSVVIDVKVGTSEGGRRINPGTHHPERSGSIRSYQPTGHRHSAEIIDQLDLPVDMVNFSATALDIVRGALATIHIMTSEKITEKELWKTYRNRYKSEPFIRIVKESKGNFRYPDPKILAGTNYCDIGFEVDTHTNRIVLISALDNLMKGAAGQAIQAMNVMFGIEEITALEFSGLHPL